MNWRKSVFAKKAVRYGFDALRFPYGYVLSDNDYKSRPPILANSFPKSGTHLLIQILQAIPGIRDWGSFLASTPSFTFNEIPARRMCRKIQRMVPSELVGAHLFYSENIDKCLKSRGITHYFIYRDPRDTVISGAYYGTYMNKWHKLHKVMKSLPNMESRILFNIEGAHDPDMKKVFPNIRKRFDKYKQWIYNENVMEIKYEDLIYNYQDETIHAIIEHYLKHTNNMFSKDKMVHECLNNINPKKSHTYRKGKIGSWKHIFTENHKSIFKRYAGNLLIELGYEQDMDW